MTIYDAWKEETEKIRKQFNGKLIDKETTINYITDMQNAANDYLDWQNSRSVEVPIILFKGQ